jgi:hypothetical protein
MKFILISNAAICWSYLFMGNMRWLEFGNNHKNNINILGTLSLMYRLKIP